MPRHVDGEGNVDGDDDDDDVDDIDDDIDDLCPHYWAWLPQE